MQLKDPAAIAYSVKPPVLTASELEEVSLDGDSFDSDQKYLEQIPGFFEKLDMASAEPIGSGQIYDEKTFWKAPR